jgi:hypothetical protein
MDWYVVKLGSALAIILAVVWSGCKQKIGINLSAVDEGSPIPDNVSRRFGRAP